MRRLTFFVPPEYEGRKVVHFLRGPGGCSATLVKSLKIYPDGILLDGVHVRTIDRLHSGQKLEITLREAAPKAQLQCAFDVPILYEDDDVIVYNKPATMACHPVKSLQQGTLANVFARDCAERGLNCPARILGRLDRDTSGAVVVAKNAFAGAALTGALEKTYVALVLGAPKPLCGVVDAPIGRPDLLDARRTVMEGGKRAVTEYETVALLEGYSAVRCTLQTGRTHQIRVHMAHLGCPLLGDALYGGDTGFIGRQALHCARVAFCQPVEKKRVVVDAPMPQDMQKLLTQNLKSW